MRELAYAKEAIKLNSTRESTQLPLSTMYLYLGREEAGIFPGGQVFRRGLPL